MSKEIENKKKSLRKKQKEITAALDSAYCREADRRILENVLSTEAYKKADTLFCYVGTEREIDTLPILKAALGDGKRVGTPRCLDRGHMEVYQIRNLKELEPGAYGIQEPVAGCPLIEPEQIDLALVPCLSCSLSGKRLGYGGGFYDRYLERTGCLRAVLCRARVMTEEIPEEPWDLAMDLVISEEGVFKPGERE